MPRPRAGAGRRTPGRVLVTAAVLGATWAISTGSDRIAASTCGPAAPGRVAVAVVVDDGGTPSTRCVEVPERSTGYDVLIAAGHTLRIEAGFLCAIDGVPATGCGNRPDWNGAYWRYFHAPPAGAWRYSTVGGGGYRMPPRCAVEGWRFSDAPGTGVAPRVSPPAVTCDLPTIAVPTTTRAAPAAPAPPPRAPSAPGVSPGPPATAPGADPAPRSGGGGSVAVPGAEPPDGRTSVESSEPSEPSADERGGDGDTGPAGSDQQASGASETDPSDAGTGPASDSEVLGAAVSAPEQPGGGSPVGTVVAAVLVASLALGGVARARRRRPGDAACGGDVTEGA